MNWLSFSIGLNALLIILVIVFYHIAKFSFLEKEELEKKLFKSDQKLAALEISNAALASRTLPRFEVDRTTENLVSLAVGKANDNESKIAALKTCQRIHKQLKASE